MTTPIAIAEVPAQKASRLLREAVAAARAGEKRRARNLIKELLEWRPDHEQGLLWAAALSESMESAFWFLQRLRQVNPNNEQALKLLARYESTPGSPFASLAAAPSGPSASSAASQPEPSRADSSRIFGRLEAPLQTAPSAKPEPAPTPLAPPDSGAAPQQPAESNGNQNSVAFSEEAPDRSEQPMPWTCPLCRVELRSAPRRCTRCGSIPSLEDLGVLAQNEGVDEKVVADAVREWHKQAVASPSFEAFSNLGLGLLNLKRSAEALPWLKKAYEVRPGENGLKMTVHILEQRRLILAVDDSVTVRKVINVILEQSGYRVVTASDGMQALARLNEVAPDLILLDVSMPRMDGYQACKVIKQNAYTKQIPVVMLSGNDGFFDKVRGRLAGACDYLTKPLDEDSLVHAVKRHLKQAH